MTPEQNVRLQCLDMAVRTAGNPNVIQNAREYLEFVNEVLAADVEEIETETAPVAKKGKAK